MRKSLVLSFIVLIAVFLFVQCNDSATTTETPADATSSPQADFNGYESQEKWGEHLVTIAGCHDCHSPKVMTPRGPVIDSTLLLSGHKAGSPPLPINAKEIQSKGLVVTGDLTSWVGPWGTSYTANLTSDPTGIGNWKEEQFFMALREGKFKGLSDGRTLLPPMPWDMYKHFKDDEIRAIFAFLKATKPISNMVPAPLPPAK